jgi:ankyrin repeat protein
MPGESTRDVKLLNGDLIHAIKTGAMVAFEKALERGASVEATDPVYKHTALMVAVERQNLEMIQRLLAAGADVNGWSQMLSFQALHIAAQHVSTEISELLLARGADIHGDGWRCRTPLHMACEAGQLPQVKLLLDKGANPMGVGNTNHAPPLMLALHSGKVEVAAYLLSRVPELFRNCDGGGLCPLKDFAYWKGHKMVEWLLNQPAPDWIATNAYFRNAAAAAVEELDDYEQQEGYEAARLATIEIFHKHGDL